MTPITYIGIDPGGEGAFGWCVTEKSPDDSFSVIDMGTCKDTQEALMAISSAVKEPPVAAGVDAPLYWVRSGDREADKQTRKQVKASGGHSATVGHVNSLRGACLVQGVLAAVELRQRWPNIRITETHPKALISIWPELVEVLKPLHFETDHERDAFAGAFAASQFFEGTEGWQNWAEMETSPLFFPTGFQVAYWSPVT